MGPSIPRKEFSRLQSKVGGLKKLHTRLLPSTLEAKGVPTQEEVEEYRKILSSIYKVIEEVKQRCAAVKIFIDHDLNGDFTCLIGPFDILGFMYEEKTTKPITENTPFDLTALVQEHLLPVIHSIEAMKFWVEDKRLQPKSRRCGEFFQKVRPYLDHAFRQKRGKKMELEIDENLEAYLDEATLGMLLLNMCKNAPTHGEASTIKIRAFSSEGKIFVTVEDDGKGIDESIAGKIFDYGFSGGKSTGIGLADAPLRMEAMGGKIECFPHGGLENVQRTKGAKFVMQLQAAS